MAPNEISARDLREHTDEILARVKAGERLTITVDGQPVGELSPPEEDQWTPKAVYMKIYERAKDNPVDDRFLLDIREAFPDTTDDLKDHWA